MSITYTVVTLDGQEHPNLEAETVKEWFLKRRLLEDSFVQSSETGEWKLLKKFFDVRMWLSQNHSNNHAPQQQFNTQPQMPRQQQQWQPQQAYTQPMPPQQSFHQPMPPPPQMYAQPMPVQQSQLYPSQQEVNAYYQPQQQYQPQTQWVSQQQWVAPPPPANSSFGQTVMGVFESAAGRAKAASISLKIIMGLTAAVLFFDIMIVLSRPNMEAVSQGQINLSTGLLFMLGGLVGVLYLIAYVVTAILFLMWLHRAYKNLQAFGVRTDDSPGWVVGYWFIPFVNLVRPYQKVKELFDKSESVATQMRCNNQDADSSIIGGWWACYLISGFISNLSLKNSFAPSTDDLILATVFDIVSKVLSLIAAWLIIKIINNIDEWQEACASTQTQNYYPQTQYGNPVGYS